MDIKNEELGIIDLGSCSDDSSPSDAALPELHLQKFTVRVARSQLRASPVEAQQLLRELKEQTTIVVALWPQHIEHRHKLELELKMLQQQVHALEIEIMEMKRKRWCQMCEEEAQFMEQQKRFFYCSAQCEKQHHKQVLLQQLMAD